MHSLELTQVVIVLVSLILAPHVAEVVAPYTVIIIASCVGAGWSLGNTEKLSRWQALWFFCRISEEILKNRKIAELTGRYNSLKQEMVFEGLMGRDTSELKETIILIETELKNTRLTSRGA